MTPNTPNWIDEAYQRYDSDPRAAGPDGYEAFREAVEAAYAEYLDQLKREMKARVEAYR